MFAGGALLWVREFSGWWAMFAAFASLYFLAVALFRRYRLADQSAAERRRQEAATTSATGGEEEGEGEQRKKPFSFREVLSVEGTLGLVCFVSFYKLCERAEQTFSLFLVDKGVPASQLALWATVVRSASLAGSAQGGAILSSSSSSSDKVAERARDVLVRFSFWRALPIAAQLAIILFWGRDRYVHHHLSIVPSTTVLITYVC